jgi:DNA-binding protein HU-beta
MTKAELIDRVVAGIAKQVSLTKKQAGDIIDLVFQEVAGAIRKNERFAYPGFGTFNVKKRKPRKGRNPRTGEVIKIKGSKTVSFKAAPQLKNKL